MRIALLAAVVVTAALPAAAGASWWTRQADLELASWTGRLETQEDGGSPEFGTAAPREENGDGRGSPAVPMLMSALLPGSGHVYLGLKRDRTSYLLAGAGFLAADVVSWTQVASNNDKGDEKRDEYYAYADAHWSEAKLAAAYNPNYPPGGPFENIANVGNEYFGFLDPSGSPITHYTQIPLWVSRQDDEREYYENLGKWDQFVFGWDDFRDPREFLSGDPQSEWLDDPRTSAHRETYRQMRRDANDYYDKRDRFVYLSIGLRVLSVLHVAYLEGLIFGGGGDQELSLAGHPVQIIAQPAGAHAGVVGASLAF